MKWQVPKMWSGDVWIVGGGSSIATEFGVPDSLVPETQEEFLEFGKYLSPIHNDYVIGVNLATFLGPWVKVAFWGDTDTYNQYRAWFDSFGGLKVSCASKFSNPKFKSILSLGRDFSKGITPQRKMVSWAGKNSGAAAINLAYHLGASRVLLLGFDMKDSPQGRIHWHTGYPDKLKPLTNKELAQQKKVPRETSVTAPYGKHLKGFPLVSQDAKRLGLEIINLCPDSTIESFPKMSVNEFLNQRERENETV